MSSPYIESDLYLPVADVVAGSIIREFKRAGGMEILDREESERLIREEGGEGWVATKEQAAFIGRKMDADIVVYSSLKRSYNQFNYNLAFYQVNTDVLQRVLSGTLEISASPGDIGRALSEEVDKLKRYVPLPSDLADPGSILRMVMVDPDSLPASHEIEGLAGSAQFGNLELVLNYFRVFPGEMDYYHLAEGAQVMRFSLREQMDEELATRHNQYYIYGDFAISHRLQAFFIENCSTRAINLLLANNIPVFYADDLVIGYHNLRPDGFCIFGTNSNDYFDTSVMTYRDRMVVMFVVPQPGQPGGVSREYLENALTFFPDEWGEIPTLVEITEGFLDFTDPSPE